MDGQLRALEKEVAADPGDLDAQRALRTALRRVADLGDRVAWSAAEPAAQDYVLEVLARRIGERLRFVESRSYACGGQAHRVGVFCHAATGALLHLIPGGHYQRGGAGAPLRQNELPSHKVRVLPFLLGRMPLLQCEWDAVGGGRDARRWRGARLPLEGVSWDEARSWLAPLGLRLPSEAEWEYACRAGTRSAYFWGEAPDPRYAWYGSGGAAWRVQPPDEHLEAANAFGLIDMAGNLGEWCEDAYVGGYAGAPRDGSARSPRRVELRVVRGGDAYNSASHCRSAARNMADRASRAAGIGARMAASVPW